MPRFRGATVAQLLRAVNVERAKVGRTLLPRTGDAPWLFRCECGHPSCHATVEMNLDEFEAVCASPDRAVLAASHEVVHVRARRDQARELRHEAEALRAQADEIARRRHNPPAELG